MHLLEVHNEDMKSLWSKQEQMSANEEWKLSFELSWFLYSSFNHKHDFDSQLLRKQDFLSEVMFLQ